MLAFSTFDVPAAETTVRVELALVVVTTTEVPRVRTEVLVPLASVSTIGRGAPLRYNS
jgi:hypothetical protein